MRALPQRIFITGIGTGVGKTISSAVMVEALQADYWKPVQCGNLELGDSELVKGLLRSDNSKIHPEAYRLKLASSPHYAAKAENVEIKLGSFNLPITDTRLIIEGAGGLMVPLNEKDVVIDLIVKLKTPAILIVRNYLGSINHTLLSIDALAQNGVELLGVIFSGDNFLDNEEIIQQLGKVKVLGHIDEAKEINNHFIKQQAKKMRKSLAQHFKF